MMKNHYATKTNDDDYSSEWEIKYDKECIPSEYALPMIEISPKMNSFESIPLILQLIPSRVGLFKIIKLLYFLSLGALLY